MSPKVSAGRREEYLAERRNSILDVAIDVFGNQGLDHATVDEIAQSAGISKGTIYLYFKSKEEIFDAILSERSLVPQIFDLMDSMDAAELPLQSYLERIGEKYLSGMESDYPLLRLFLADSHKSEVQTEHVYNNLMLKADQKLAEVLTAQAQAGKIRPLEFPLITARLFFGMLLVYVLSQEILGGKRYTAIQCEDWVKETVRLFLVGIQIESN